MIALKKESIPLLGKAATTLCYGTAIFIILLCNGIFAVTLNATLKKQMASETPCRVWVVFSAVDSVDKKEVSAKALLRRVNNKVSLIREPKIRLQDIEALVLCGGEIQTRCDWISAVSVSIASKNLPKLSLLPGVEAIIPVQYHKSRQLPLVSMRKSATTGQKSQYGFNGALLSKMKIQMAHTFISATTGKLPGEGIVVASIDNGFRFEHTAYSSLVREKRIVASFDFVDASIGVNPASLFDEHGTQTLSLLASYQPESSLGVLYKASYVLARTENDSTEKHAEEEQWVLALMWAESLGVDLVTSSLGYRYDFTAPDTDYTFVSLDGKTTIVAAAARAAIDRGILIVNAMGNDGPYDSTVSSPADVNGVVSVGSVNDYGDISFFSSRGPTSDGRIKPDVCAPGEGVYVVSGASGYMPNSGTSFSAPLVAGICGLIVQAHPLESAEQIKSYLYASCNYSPFQNARNVTFGYGIPNAYFACAMQKENVQLAEACIDIYVCNEFGTPLAQSIVRSSNDSVLGVSDDRGFLRVVRKNIPLPETLTVHHSSTDAQSNLVVSVVPARTQCIIRTLQIPLVIVDSLSGKRIVTPVTVYYKKTEDTNVLSQQNVNGVANCLYKTYGMYEIFAEGSGYQKGNKRTVMFDSTTDTVYYRLLPVSYRNVQVYPNVVSYNNPAKKINFSFVGKKDDPLVYSQRCIIEVRSITGKLVWTHSEIVTPDNPPVISYWTCISAEGGEVVPGMYWLTIHYAATVKRFKILIKG